MRSLLRVSTLVLSVPALVVVVAWAVGDLSEPMAVPGEGQTFPVVRLERSTELAIVALSWLIVMAGALFVLRGCRPGAPGHRVVVAAMPMLALAPIVGAGYRVTSASVVGANIGAGLVTMVLAAGIPLAVVATVLLARQPDRAQSGKGAPPEAR